jgi:hypothetical protein
VLLEESREIALGAKAEVFGNTSDFILVMAQAADRCLDTQRIDIDARAEAGAASEQMIEVRAGRPSRRSLLLTR